MGCIIGTLERAREFERILVSLDAADLHAVTPELGRLAVPTLIVWGTDDEFFDVSWAYWLRDTIPGTTRVVTVDGARVMLTRSMSRRHVSHPSIICFNSGTCF